MITLTTYIKNEFIKNKFQESCKTISTIEEAEKIAKHIAAGDKDNLIFSTSAIKERFFNTLSILRGDVNIINCNSSYERFLDSINNNTSSLIVYNNINKCNDLNMLKIIQENKGIMIC